jgi:hypothetical protein
VPKPEPYVELTAAQYREAIVCHTFMTQNGTGPAYLMRTLGVSGATARGLLAEAAGWQARADQPIHGHLDDEGRRLLAGRDTARGTETGLAARPLKKVRSSDVAHGQDWRFSARDPEFSHFLRDWQRHHAGVRLPSPQLVTSSDGGLGDDARRAVALTAPRPA